MAFKQHLEHRTGDDVLREHFDGIIFGDAVIQVIFQLAVEFVEGTAGFGIRIGKDAF